MTRHIRDSHNVEAARDEYGFAREARERVREADETVTVRIRCRSHPKSDRDDYYDDLEAVEYTVRGKRRVRCEDDSRYDMSELDECPECGVLMTYLGKWTDACIECQGDSDGE